MSKIIKLRNIKRALSLKPDPSSNYLLSGRVNNWRPYKSFNFVDLTDGSSHNHLQLIISKELLKKPEVGSYISCLGNLVESQGKKQNVEFKVNKVEYLGECDPTSYPLATAPNASNNWYRSLLHLRTRAPQFSSLLRVRSELELSLHMIMKQMDFFKVHTPCLTSNDSEASSDLFVVKRSKIPNKHKFSETNNNNTDELDDNQDSHYYETSQDYLHNSSEQDLLLKEAKQGQERVVQDDYFNKDVFLVTSAQLHLENLAASLSRVYTIAPAFRAERSLSTRHLCEFLMMEAEESGITDLETLMDRVESIFKFAAQFLAEVSEYKADFVKLIEENSNSTIYEKLAHKPYVRMNYVEALQILKDKTKFTGNTTFGADIGRVQERFLLEHCDNIPIFITNFPKQLKPFYMKCDTSEEKALCFDLIAPHGGEVCGGSLREESSEKLLNNLKFNQANNLEQFNWYLDLRRFGTFPHGGFGIGIERMLQSLLGVKNIKDSTAFPRWAGRCPM